VNLLSAGEGLTMAAKAGLDVGAFIEGCMEGAAGSFMVRYVGERALARDFDPGFRIELQQKDLRLCLQMAEQLQVPLPGAALANQLFRSRQAAGAGDGEGNQALIRVYEELANFTISGT
jgi:3-hydroxyisobutyrate dehydrogenase